ncbi:MAG TPA: calcium-binding protein, partial [Thermodesulfobacteriota bacterium]|nr:calcium-binding protein [Thermodesulfobacteriota bacterium]
STLDSLWTAGGPCRSGFGDPIVLYDRLANRWLMSEFTTSGNHLCVYVSRTPDPVSGGWFLYDFTTPDFPDYPKYAVWPDAYYVSTNESRPTVYALDRKRMLNGQPATFQRFTAPVLRAFSFQSLTPADLDGAVPPPEGSPGYFMRHRDDEVHNPVNIDPDHDLLEIWEFRVDFDNPADSTFTGPINIEVEEFDSDLCGLTSFSCFPQPDTSTALDPLREVIMWRLQYRNFGTHETLVGNLVTDVDGTDHGGIRWFELRRIDGGPWTLFQEGTYAPDAANRWMGSISMDRDGNIAMGYSVSSTEVFPSIRYVGRLESDPLGTMPQGEFTLVEGTGSQTSSTRWGDYSSINVDPTDDCTFWYTSEYTAGSVWSTRIGSFRFPTCTTPDNLCGGLPADITGTPGDDLIEGTPGFDVINGLGGNDIIRGLGGDDLICGGDGDDILKGNGGADSIFGGSGSDRLNGGNGNDTLMGGGGNDTLRGNEDSDTLDGGTDTDRCNGGTEKDTATNCETVINVP